MFSRIIGVTRRKGILPVLLVAVIALTLGAIAPGILANDNNRAKAQIPFTDAKILIEVNATDGDAGIQVFLDGEGWEKAKVVSPNGNGIFEVKGKGGVGEQGVTELFFESAEPSFEDLPLDEFLARFPEGEYQFLATTVEGDELAGTAMLTHDIPNGPHLVSPEENSVLDPGRPIVIEWESVTDQFTGPSEVKIAGYQVIVEHEDPLRVFSVDLPATATRATVAPEFLEPGADYKFEVLAIEASGNQTITESSFKTE
jgi:hypothetical protein